MAEPRTYKLALPRFGLNIVEWGDPAAPPLILQHGGRDHARSWDWVAAAFASTHRIIAPDLRGHGDSDWANDGGYEMMDFVQDFADLIRALDLPPCAVVGHSLGGNIATRFAGLYPDRVTRLVNIEGLGDSPEIARRRAAQDMAIQLREWIEQRAKLNGFAPRPYDRAALVARVHEKNPRLSIVMAEHLATHAARIGADGVLRLKHDPAFHANSPIDISFDTKRALWAAIRCPVLLVYGAESWASNPAIDGRAADFVDARVELFEQAGHWVHHDRTEDFITMVRGFLA